MRFKDAYKIALEDGLCIKLPYWKDCYWYWSNQHKTMMVHLIDGDEIDIRETHDVMFIFDNICSDEWEITPAMNTQETNTMDFGDAIKYIKQGYKLKRQGWNGKNQYVELATDISYKDMSNDVINCNHDAIGNKALAFVGTSGTQLGWLASQADMLAADWELVK